MYRRRRRSTQHFPLQFACKTESQVVPYRSIETRRDRHPGERGTVGERTYRDTARNVVNISQDLGPIVAGDVAGLNREQRIVRDSAGLKPQRARH